MHDNKLTDKTIGTGTFTPADFREIVRLQTILDEINNNIAETCVLLSQLLEQARGSTFEATNLLQKILLKRTEDTSKSIELISQGVSVLQGLIIQIKWAADPETAKKSSETESQRASFTEDDISLVLDFIAEANEHIELAEAGLLRLKTKPDDRETLNQIFRAFYTIKGMAGFLNLIDIGELAYSAENLLDMAQKGELKLAGKNIDVIFESLEMLKEMILDLKESELTRKTVLKQKKLPQMHEKLKSLSLAEIAQK